MQKKFAVGIDIGATNTKFGIVNQEGKILAQDRFKTNENKGFEGFVHLLDEKLSPMIKEFQTENFVGIGIGAPNGNYFNGTIEHAANLQWEGIIPVIKIIEEKFNLPAKITNDANAAAVGEQKYGVAKEMKNFITITLGTGVGSGIITNGEIMIGHNGFAGELGHIVVRKNGRLHPKTGLKGTLEAYTSATGVRETALEILNSNPDLPCLLRNYSPEEITSEIVYLSATKGDKISKEIFNFTGNILGESLATFAHFCDPEAIVLFGGLTKAGDLLLTPTIEAMEENLLTNFKGKIKVLLSNLNEAEAAILGASALVW